MIKECIAKLRTPGRPSNRRLQERLSWSQKISRLGTRMRDREWRRYGKLLLAGKLMGIGLVVGVLFLGPDLIGWTTFAADADLKGNDIVNPINTVWVLVAAFLVFAMQVGFTMLEAGFCRSRTRIAGLSGVCDSGSSSSSGDAGGRNGESIVRAGAAAADRCHETGACFIYSVEPRCRLLVPAIWTEAQGGVT